MGVERPKLPTLEIFRHGGTPHITVHEAGAKLEKAEAQLGS